MHSYVTLFDKNYLPYGLLLIQSMQENFSSKYCLYILAMDSDCEQYLKTQNFPNVVVESLSSLMDFYPVLKRLKEERTHQEFSWGLSAFSTSYILKKYMPSDITYIDADMYFYSDPSFVFEKMDDKSVLITPHNYYYKYDQSETSGRYCVQFVTFKNDNSGPLVLEWWRQRVEECCTAKPENGLFGDQKYLDDWLSRFDCVWECDEPGMGLAPWNCCKYELVEENEKFCIIDKLTKLRYEIVFFHFHGAKLVEYSGRIGIEKREYSIDDAFKKHFYCDYKDRLATYREKVEQSIILPEIKQIHQIGNLKILLKSLKNCLCKFYRGFDIVGSYKNVKAGVMEDKLLC